MCLNEAVTCAFAGESIPEASECCLELGDFGACSYVMRYAHTDIMHPGPKHSADSEQRVEREREGDGGRE